MGQTPKTFAQVALTRSLNTNVYTAPSGITADLITDYVLSNNTKLDNPTPPTITQGGTAGTTTYNYYVVANDAWGGKTLASSVGTTTTGNATLSASNYNTITWTPVLGAVSYDILKGTTATSLVTGTVGTVSGVNLTYNDTGQATAGYTATTVNSTGIKTFVSVHRVPSGGAASLTNRIISNYEVDPGMIADVQLNTTLATGDMIQAKVSSGVSADSAVDNNVSLCLSGIEFS